LEIRKHGSNGGTNVFGGKRQRRPQKRKTVFHKQPVKNGGAPEEGKKEGKGGKKRIKGEGKPTRLCDKIQFAEKGEFAQVPGPPEKGVAKTKKKKSDKEKTWAKKSVIAGAPEEVRKKE